MSQPPPGSTLFPYTTLFRSLPNAGGKQHRLLLHDRELVAQVRQLVVANIDAIEQDLARWRSEEHTSELQSRGHLVCRLLLEKKKKEHRLRNLVPAPQLAVQS